MVLKSTYIENSALKLIMGYSTWFTGKFYLNKKLDDDITDILHKLSEGISDLKDTPRGRCQWITCNQNSIIFDGGEKCYYYVDWLHYLVDKILKPKNYVLHGTMVWIAENDIDKGLIVISNNKITIAGTPRIHHWDIQHPIDYEIKIAEIESPNEFMYYDDKSRDGVFSTIVPQEDVDMDGNDSKKRQIEWNDKMNNDNSKKQKITE